MGHRQPFVPIGVAARALIYIGYFMLIVAALFGVAYGNILLVVICLLSGFLGFVGLKYGDLDKTTKLDQTPIKRKLDSILKWVAFQLGAFAFLDAFIPHFFSVQFFGFVVPLGSGISIDPSQFLTVGFVFTEAESIMEELLIRLGVVNLALRLRNVGPTGAALISGFLFGLIHIPAYGLDVPVLIILGGAGVIFAVGDMRTNDVATSMFSHMLNNAIAWFYQASLLVGGSFLMLIPQTPLGIVELGAAMAFMPMSILALRRKEVRSIG